MADVKWIRLSTGMFDDEKIRLIEKMPEADTILIIWIKLLAQAGKTNASGYIYLAESIPFTDEMIAAIFDRPLNTVRMALQTFQRFRMLEIFDDNMILIENWDKHQNVEGLERIREQNRLRKQKERDRKKLGQPETDHEMSRDKSRDQSQTIDIELDKELDKEKEKDIVPFKEIIDHLNLMAGTGYKASGKKTREQIRARWNDGFVLEDFLKVIDNKVGDWLQDPKMSGYLRPETLFSNKFEGYLNQKGGSKGGKTADARKTAEEYQLGF